MIASYTTSASAGDVRASSDSRCGTDSNRRSRIAPARDRMISSARGGFDRSATVRLLLLAPEIPADGCTPGGGEEAQRECPGAFPDGHAASCAGVRLAAAGVSTG